MINIESRADVQGVSLVHAQQVSGKEGGFIPAGAGADFHEGVAVLGRIPRQEAVLHALGKGCGSRFQVRQLGARHFPQFIILVRQGAVLLQLPLHAAGFLPVPHEFLQAAVLAHELLRPPAVVKERRVGNSGLQLGEPLAAFFNEGAVVHGAPPF